MFLEPVPPALPLDHLALRGADDAPALLLRSGTLTYEALRTRVARLAGWLREDRGFAAPAQSRPAELVEDRA